MKGISTIIATILMLMITIGISGTAYLYVSGFFSSKTSVLLSIDSGSRCTANGITVLARNNGNSVSGNTSIDITYPNSTRFTQQCYILQINPGTYNSTLCPIQITNGYYGIRASGSGSVASGIVYCSVGAGGATTTTTASAPTTDTIGDTSGNADLDGCWYIAQVTASASGTLQTLGTNIQTSAGNLRLAIYSDSGGSPATLLAQTNSVPMSGTGWNDVSSGLTGITITSGTKYWLVGEYDNPSAKEYYGGGGGKYATTHCGIYEAFTNPFPASSSIPTIPNLRMTYQ